MIPSLEYLAQKAEEIERNPTGKYDCTSIANELKKILIEEGKDAEKVRFGILNQYGEPLQSITPISLPGKSWLYHDVCSAEEELIYDPFAGKEIISLDEYALRMFGKEIPYYTKDELGRLYEELANKSLRLLTITQFASP